MSDYISEIFERTDLQQIREFLLYGTECCDKTNDTYIKRLKAAENVALKKIKENFSGLEEYDKATDDIYHFVGVTKDVYMEIGMKCGAKLTKQLLSEE